MTRGVGALSQRVAKEALKAQGFHSLVTKILHLVEAIKSESQRHNESNTSLKEIISPF
jgi:hypothetical protein